MRKAYLGLLLLAGSLAASGQTIDVTEFFARQLPAAGADASRTDGRLRTPLIQSYDLRTETDEFDLRRQEYTLRLNFSTPRLARAQQNYYQQLLSAPPTEREEADCALIADTYTAWTELYLIDRRVSLLDSLEAVLTDRGLLLERALRAQRTELDELVDLRADRTDLQLRRLEQVRRRGERLTTFGISDAQQALDFSGFIDPSTIERVVSVPTTTLADAELEYRMALLEREIEVERAEGRQVIDFLQFRYRDDPRDVLREKFSIGLALRITDEGDRHLKLRELELERDWLRTRAALEAQLRDDRTRAARQQLLAALEHYRQTGRAIVSERTDLDRVAALTTDPVLLLEIEARRLRRQLDYLDGYARLLEAYLEWLGAAGQLCLEARGGWIKS